MKKQIITTFVFIVISSLLIGQNSRMGSASSTQLLVVPSAKHLSGGGAAATATGMDAAFWNPAGLAFSKTGQLYFMNQSWIAGIDHSYTSISFPLNRIGTLGLSLNLVNYGEIEVTNLDFQDGTGEYYSALDYSVSFSFAKKFVNWFGFGSSVKLINSKIWHSSASAFAIDLGAQIYLSLIHI